MKTQLEQLLLLKGRSALPGVLLAAAECAPLSKTGGLADVVGALPRALAKLGFDARVITPYHRCIKDAWGDRVQHLCHIYIDLGWRHQYAGLELLELPGLTVYLVDSEYYFGDRIYRGGAAEVEQYAFFQRAVLELLPLLPDFAPEVLHCNDWHTAMLPFLLRTQYAQRPQGALKTVLTIHNMAFQGWCSPETAADLLGIEPRWLSWDGVLHGTCANFLAAGCRFAHRVNTVSPTYADEIRTAAFGEGLQDLLLARGGDVSGILNGLDTVEYDPAADRNLPVNFDAACPEKKRENKAALLAELGLTGLTADTPLIAMVTRMTAQKGFDLVLQALDTLMAQDVGFVLLGTGDAAFENAMRGFEQRYKGRLCAYLNYNEALSRRIYAGADFLLMPSAFEPCGLSQMIAMRYGALPIVHEVGGLRDTVRPYDCTTGAGNGFSFYDFNCGTLLGTVAYALATYRDKAAMQTLIHTAMTTDVSFDPSAVAYGRVYLSVLDTQGCALRHDPADESFRDPPGAVRCGQTVTLRLLGAAGATQASLTVGGSSFPMTAQGDGAFSVDWTAPETPGLAEYGFCLSGGVWFGADGVGASPMRPWTVTVYDRDFTTPAWAEGAVLYQIFPDRFAPGGTAFARGVKQHRKLGRSVEVHADWDQPVKFGDEDYRPDDFYGGTLQGITQQLPQLQALGVTVLYLNPIFESPSNHRYDTADYHRIDPMLGTLTDFRALCRAAKARGIRVILDGVFSHTGDDSVYFDRCGHYGGGACAGPDSPYYTWFDFRDFPDDYRCWWGFPSLPEVNETDPHWQEFIIRGQDAVLPYWLKQGAAGWRLDVADELPDEVIEAMRAAVKSAAPDALLLGEVWEDATTKISYGRRRTYALGRGLDSVMNYPLRAALLDFALYRSGAPALRDFLAGQKLSYPPEMYRCLMNLLGSHDTARLRTVLGAGQDGSGMRRSQQADFALTPGQNARGAALQRLCAAVQFALPGMPSVYYGDEEGMQGFRDPFCRGTYRQAEPEMRAWYADLAALRAGSAALSRGDAAFAAYGEDVLCILRYGLGEARLIAVNRSETAQEITPAAADFVTLRRGDAAKLGPLPALAVPAMGTVMAELPFQP